MTNEAPTGVLTLAQAAAGTQTNEFAWQRAAARGRIPSTRLGHGDDWSPSQLRILASDLQKYVQAGAPDFQPPPMVSGWFSDNEYRVGNRAVELMTAAAQSQAKSDEAVRAEFASKLAKTQRTAMDVNAASNVEVQLVVSDAVLAAANKAPSELDRVPSRYKSIFRCLVASRLRSAAKEFMGSYCTLQRLYSNEYQTIAAGALELLKSRAAVIFTRATPITDGPERGAMISTTYRLNFGQFKLDTAIEDAF